jgi:NADH-quinone oxidoreductase subunit G/[NiFe] hydrogenase diaphorase moiety small subunit
MNTNTSQGLPRGKSGDTDATDRPALVDITIDERPVSVPSGTTILEAARSIGARIPTLCHHDDLCAAGACRLCLVEVKGQRTLQAACTFPITQPVEVTTSSRRIRKARQHILDLLLSEHHGECHTCPRNTTCELQALAKEHGVDTPRFGRPAGPAPRPDDSGFAIVRDPGKCILCRRCTRTCGGLQDVGALGVAGRGEHTRVSTYLEKPLADVVCINCGQCVNRCPTGALRVNNSTDEVWEAIDDPDKHVIIQTAPSPRAAIGEEFGLAPGTSVTWRLNTALRRCGFDKVFDTNFSADLTIMEEGAELLARLHRRLALGDPEAALPLFTSCSPGWIKYLEHFHPEYLPNLSTCKSPQQMFGALIKTWYAQSRGIDPAKVVSVALMPCTAKKFECRRPEMRASGHHDVDYALTTRELAQMIREAGIRQRLGGHLRGHGRSHGGRPAQRHRVRHRPESGGFPRARRHHSPARIRGLPLRRGGPARAPRPGPRTPRPPPPGLRLAGRGHAEGRRGPRHGQRPEGPGGHPRRRTLQPVPFHRVHGLPGRVPGRGRTAQAHERGHPHGPGQGHLRRGRGLRPGGTAP